jgi:hypothetical protein
MIFISYLIYSALSGRTILVFIRCYLKIGRGSRQECLRYGRQECLRYSTALLYHSYSILKNPYKRDVCVRASQIATLAFVFDKSN